MKILKIKAVWLKGIKKLINVFEFRIVSTYFSKVQFIKGIRYKINSLITLGDQIKTHQD